MQRHHALRRCSMHINRSRTRYHHPCCINPQPPPSPPPPPPPARPQVFRQRLEQEHGASVLVTAPTVPCRCCLGGAGVGGGGRPRACWHLQPLAHAPSPPAPPRPPNPPAPPRLVATPPRRIQVAGADEPVELQNPAEYPLGTKVVAGGRRGGGLLGPPHACVWGGVAPTLCLPACLPAASMCTAAHPPTNCHTRPVWEPTVESTIVTPNDHVGGVIQLCQERRGDLGEHSVLGAGRTLLR